jgi:hypothetical protein
LILGREIPGKEIDMTSSEVRQSRATAIDLSGVSAALWLAGTVFLALLVLYFIGIDQGASSIFGSDTHIHEFVHDARHLLGFPCH